MSSENEKVPRVPYLWEALLSFGFLVAVMVVGIGVFGVDPHIPMMIGASFAALMAFRLGFKWKQIERAMFDGIYNVLQAVIILFVIGVIIGVWMVAGIVPTMIYYGLNILSARTFLVATLLICSVTSVAIGTSWGTAGTIGVALMGVAIGLGINPAVAAGAVVSGAYFGDKLSPLSDTTNLAAAMAGTDLFTHIKFMLRNTIPVYIIVIVIYIVLGINAGNSNASFEGVKVIQDGIAGSFNISPFLLIPPIVVIVLVAFKIPAIPGIFAGVIIGGIFGAIFQGNTFGDLLEAAYGGYQSATGIEAVDDLLSKGGLEGIMFAISLIIIAMMFGGIMEKTRQLEVVVSRVVSAFKSITALVGVTMLTALVSNITIPDQYIAIVVPGRMFAPEYKRRGLHPKMCSNAVDSCGTVTSALVPWNTCGIAMATFLGVATFEYLPYAFFNLLGPIAVLVMTAMGLQRVKRSQEPSTILDYDEKEEAKLQQGT
ncbi:MAG: Na+/H+ antiporter NhaC [Treponema sp.]|nr:Na+/H+ antiporter NhaC [Treponema sp.]